VAFSTSVTIFGIDRFSEAAKKIQGSLSGLSTKMQSLNKKAAHFGKQAKAFGSYISTRIGIPTLAAVATFGKMEKGLTNVLTLLSKEEILVYKDRLRKIQDGAIGLGFSIEDTNKAMFDNISALQMNESAIQAFEMAQKLAIGGVTEISTTVSGLAAVMNSYGKETTSASEVANAFFSAQRAGMTTVEKLALNVGTVAPIAKQAGIGFKELLATMSQLTLGGLSTDMAATALRGAISGLLKPADQAAKVLKYFNVPVGLPSYALKG